MSELQLEVGKRYIRRDGNIIRIDSKNDHDVYQFIGSDRIFYNENGLFGDGESNYDLISEVPCDYDFEMGAQYDDDAQQDSDPVNHPKHYTYHPSGIECIQITEHMSFCLGNAIKYLWRADLKLNAIEDMRKAIWYIEREIAKRSNP